MLCFNVLFMQSDKGAAYDDRINIYSHEGSNEIFQVKYHSPDMRGDRMFLASFSGVLQYVEDTLTSMCHDTEPFENIQINSSIHPPVLYHVSDMDDYTIRNLVMNMLRDSLRFNVRVVS